MQQVQTTLETLARLSPSGSECVVRTPLADDECTWFNIAVKRGLVGFRNCPEECPRRLKRGAGGPDHFTSPSGAARHLFSSPELPAPSLNREYIPHIAAWSRLVYDFGHDPKRLRFSFYRRYTRDLLTKRAGGSYETDIEVYDEHGHLHVQVEAKKDTSQVAKLARQLDAAGDLADLPLDSAKEIEYVLDLAPRYLWIVGPGTVEPASHVFHVTVANLNARFERLKGSDALKRLA